MPTFATGSVMSSKMAGGGASAGCSGCGVSSPSGRRGTAITAGPLLSAAASSSPGTPRDTNCARREAACGAQTVDTGCAVPCASKMQMHTTGAAALALLATPPPVLWHRAGRAVCCRPITVAAAPGGVPASQLAKPTNNRNRKLPPSLPHFVLLPRRCDALRAGRNMGGAAV